MFSNYLSSCLNFEVGLHMTLLIRTGLMLFVFVSHLTLIIRLRISQVLHGMQSHKTFTLSSWMVWTTSHGRTLFTIYDVQIHALGNAKRLKVLILHLKVRYSTTLWLRLMLIANLFLIISKIQNNNQCYRHKFFEHSNKCFFSISFNRTVHYEAYNIVFFLSIWEQCRFLNRRSNAYIKHCNIYFIICLKLSSQNL